MYDHPYLFILIICRCVYVAKFGMYSIPICKGVPRTCLLGGILSSPCVLMEFPSKINF